MRYQVKDPDGNLHVIDGPDGATPDQIIAQAQKLIPAQQTKQGPDWKGVVGQGVKEAFMQPDTLTRKLATSPTAQAKALPALAGLAGGMSPIPGGATMGTVGGRQLSNLALKTYGQGSQIPSGMQQAGEAGLAALGDIAAIPAMKKAYYGGQIGEAEKAAGLVTRAPTKAVTPGSVGETLNNLEAQIDAGTINTPQAARDAKAVVNQIYKNPKIYEQTSDIKVQAQRVSKKVQDLLNAKVPGRAEPAQAMAQAMTIPNALGRAYNKVPWQVKLGALGGGADATIRKLLGLQ